MDRDSIIGIAVLIILALVAINYYNVDCSAITEKGSGINQDLTEPERGNVTGSGWLPPPSIEAKEDDPNKPDNGNGNGNIPGGPIRPPSPGPPVPPGP